ncbi:MAG: sodium:proton antiporter [Mucilaginibacter polytrichastri]|nr:sodium:proton antiporter [Mucilaginibacter polytrichastri]
MSTFTLITALVCISAIFSYVNLRFLKIPGTIGIMAVAIIVSLIILITGKSFAGISEFMIAVSRDIDFSKAVLDVMLGFLLFAGSLHFDVRKLRENRRPVITLATVGVILSTAVFGGLFYEVTKLVHQPIPLIYCFILGALISPTDPIAVASILKRSKIPNRLQTIISGESLFNDGVGIVLFVTLSEIAENTDKKVTLGETALLFLQEVGGGIALGLVAAVVAVKMIRKISDFQTMMLITLSLVMGLSVVAAKFHLSAPLSVVAAGLYVGNMSLSLPGSEHRDDVLQKIWSLLDDVLNTILFVLIGLQLVTMPYLENYWQIGIVAFFLVIISRAVSISLPVIFVRRKLRIRYDSIVILTWAGLRGGISVALALSLPESPYREVLLAASYFIVILSILGQGLTLNKVANAVSARDAESAVNA